MLKTVVLLNIFVETVMALSYDFEALGSFHERVCTLMWWKVQRHQSEYLLPSNHSLDFY